MECLEDSGGFIAEITIVCAECGKPFQLLGLEPGVGTQGARVSIDGLEAKNVSARDAAEPISLHPSEFQGG
jgi:hypothetical protein